jgi:hypothetical protein
MFRDVKVAYTALFRIPSTLRQPKGFIQEQSTRLQNRSRRLRCVRDIESSPQQGWTLTLWITSPPRGMSRSGPTALAVLDMAMQDSEEKGRARTNREGAVCRLCCPDEQAFRRKQTCQRKWFLMVVIGKIWIVDRLLA